MTITPSSSAADLEPRPGWRSARLRHDRALARRDDQRRESLRPRLGMTALRRRRLSLCAEAVAQSRLRKGASRSRKWVPGRRGGAPSRAAGGVRRTTWSFSEPTLRTDQRSSPGVCATATATSATALLAAVMTAAFFTLKHLPLFFANGTALVIILPLRHRPGADRRHPRAARRSRTPGTPRSSRGCFERRPSAGRSFLRRVDGSRPHRPTSLGSRPNTTDRSDGRGHGAADGKREALR